MAKKRITPGLYYFNNFAHVDGGAQHTGSQASFTWAQMEPAKGQLSGAFDTWAAAERAHSKSLVLRVDVHQNRGARSLPGWVPRLRMTLNNGGSVEVPDYGNPELQRHLTEFVRLLGARYDGLEDLVMVQIATGLYGETHPERNDDQGALSANLYDGGKLTACGWIDYCRRVIDAYADAFPTTELVIMNAPTYPYPCRSTTPPYPAIYPRLAVDTHAMAAGVGAQNNSLDDWDANWFTTEVVGSNGAYTVDGCVGPFAQAGRMLAFERGTWGTVGPFPRGWNANTSLTWWCYLNALSKGARVIFPANWAGKVLVPGTQSYHEYSAGVWGYEGPYADELRWMNDFALRSMRGELRWWVAFDAPKGDYWHGTAQHTDHELGVHRLTEMTSDWGEAEAVPPYYEDKYRRRLAGTVDFATTTGRYQVTIWYRGSVEVLGRTLPQVSTWRRETWETDVPAQFGVSGSGYLHAIILEPAAAPPVEPPTDPPEEPTETTVILGGKRITIRVEDL